MKKICGIYKVVNKLNGHFYVGSSNNIYRRWQDHQRLARNGSTICAKFYSALRKHKPDKFVWKILQECSEKKLQDFEQVWLDKCVGKKECYNLAMDAKSPNRGLKWSRVQRRKIANRIIRLICVECGEEFVAGSGVAKWCEKCKIHGCRQCGNECSHYNNFCNHSCRAQYWFNKSQRGSGNYASKLTEAEVRKIRKLYVPHVVSQRELGKQFGVDGETIGTITRYENWRHVA